MLLLLSSENTASPHVTIRSVCALAIPYVQIAYIVHSTVGYLSNSWAFCSAWSHIGDRLSWLVMSVSKVYFLSCHIDQLLYIVIHCIVYVTCTLTAAAQCLLVYNYIISRKYGGAAAQRAMLLSDLPGGPAGRSGSDPSRAGRTFLLGGRRDGCLCVYNWETGAVDYVTEVR